MKIVRIEEQLEIPRTPEDIWPIIRQREWVYEAIGIPPGARHATPLPEGGTALRGQARLWGANLDWQESPTEWLEAEFFRDDWQSGGGLFERAQLGCELRPAGPGSSNLRIHLHLTPRPEIGPRLLDAWLADRFRKRLSALLPILAHNALNGGVTTWPGLSVSRTREQALRERQAKLAREGEPSDLLHLLQHFLRAGADTELARVQPSTLARQWERGSWEVLRLLLHATRCGLFTLRWELVCPRCRLPQDASTASLADLPAEVSCWNCTEAFRPEIDRTVQVRFAVHPEIRSIGNHGIPAPGPGNQPHVVSQIVLAPGQRRAWRIPELNRAFRLWSPQVKEPVTLSPEETPLSVYQPLILCEADSFKVKMELDRARDCSIQVMNPNPFPVQLLLERPEWDGDFLSAARLCAWNFFRRMFPGEVVPPRTQWPCGLQVIAFTRLFDVEQRAGGLHDHALQQAVEAATGVCETIAERHRGSIVNLADDTLFMVFGRPDEALATVREAHEELPHANPNASLAAGFRLRSALHIGSCLAVNKDGRLDLVGANVAMTQRLLEACPAGQMMFTEKFCERAEAQEFLLEHELQPAATEITLAGPDSPLKVWRLSLA